MTIKISKIIQISNMLKKATLSCLENSVYTKQVADALENKGCKVIAKTNYRILAKIKTESILPAVIIEVFEEENSHHYAGRILTYEQKLQLFLIGGKTAQEFVNNIYSKIELLIEHYKYFSRANKNEKIKKISKINNMKFFKINQADPERPNTLESPEAEDFLQHMPKNESKEDTLSEYHTAEILEKITDVMSERIDSKYIANGAEGIFEYDDGKIYKITIEPI